MIVTLGLGLGFILISICCVKSSLYPSKFPLKTYLTRAMSCGLISISSFGIASFGIGHMEADASSKPQITSRVFLDFSINRKAPERVSIGLYGNESPTGTKIFLAVCSGEYMDGSISYDGSQVSLIQKDKKIEVGKFALGSAQKQETWMDSMGKVRLRNLDRAAMAVNNDVNDLKHDIPGRVSVPKGGKSFAFTLTPQSNKDLDETNVVIGEVIDGFDTIKEINQVPVSKEDILGTKTAFATAGKAFDGRAKLASVQRPLQKVQILQCKVDQTGSVASFLRY